MTADTKWVADTVHKIPVSLIVLMQNEIKKLIHPHESLFHESLGVMWQIRAYEIQCRA